MEVKEAIKWLGRLKKIHDRGIFNIEQNANEVIELLQENEYLGRILMCPKDFYKRSDKLKRGEKFEAMWEKIKDIISSHSLLWLEKRMGELERENLSETKTKHKEEIDKICREFREFHEKLLEKYFPEEE